MSQPLGELLVEAGVLSAAELESLLARELTDGEARIRAELHAIAGVHERALAETLCRDKGHPAVVLSQSTVDLVAVGLVPRIIAERQRLLPLAVDDDTLTLAVADLALGPLLDQLQFASGRVVLPVLAVRPLLDDALRRAYDAFDRREKTWRGDHASSPAPALMVVRDVADDVEVDQAEFAESLLGDGRGAALFGDLDELEELGPAFTRLEHGDVKTDPAPEEDAPTAVAIGQIVLKQVPVVRLARQAAPPGVVADGEGVDVVIAEDDDAIAALVRRALEHDGYKVRVAATGDAAVQLLREVRPRLILLDAMLPGVHGFEICARLKQSESFRGVPVVMISAVYKGWEHAREIQEVHGADAFVEKPFDVHFLRKLAAGLLGTALQRAPLGLDVTQAIERAREHFDTAYLHGEWDAAEAAVRDWLRSDPFDGHAYLELGNICCQRHDLASAMRAFETAAVYSPQSFSARTNLALVYERLGFRRRAVDTWRAARALAPDPATQQRIEERLAQQGG